MGRNRFVRREIDYPLAVYVPNPDDPIGRATTILRGSGIIGVPYQVHDILAYFEGNKYGFSNVVTWADRCYHAASRMGAGADNDFPTVALAVYPAEALTPVGTFDGERITPLDGGARRLAREWLNLSSGSMLVDECLRTGHSVRSGT